MLSVIIPTLNEAAAIGQTLECVRANARGTAIEVIVSDCDSTDGTAEIARGLGAKVVSGGRCRSAALNLGARAASGQVLLFLHADTVLPERYAELVCEAVRKPGVVGGAFDFNFGPHPLNHGLNRQWLRAVRVMNRVRFRWTGNYYGDQAIFCRRDAFVRAGGFPKLRLLEDAKFCPKMRRLGRTTTIAANVKTSPRRFVTRGVLRQLFCDLRMIAVDSMGMNICRDESDYNQLNKTGKYR